MRMKNDAFCFKKCFQIWKYGIVVCITHIYIIYCYGKGDTKTAGLPGQG